MKRFFSLGLLCSVFLVATEAQTASQRAVYLFPMTGGIDQYLANWLTKEHVLQVTSDPNSADLVMTDRLTPAFEQKLEDLHPRDSDPEADDSQHPYKGGQQHGTIFLLDAKTRNVVWSEFRKPRAASPAHLNREARILALKLRSSFSK